MLSAIGGSVRVVNIAITGSSGIVVGRENIQRNDRLSIWQSNG